MPSKAMPRKAAIWNHFDSQYSSDSVYLVAAGLSKSRKSINTPKVRAFLQKSNKGALFPVNALRASINITSVKVANNMGLNENDVVKISTANGGHMKDMGYGLWTMTSHGAGLLCTLSAHEYTDAETKAILTTISQQVDEMDKYPEPDDQEPELNDYDADDETSANESESEEWAPWEEDLY